MKAILLIWIGFGGSQTLGVDHFDTIVECHAAAAALKAHDRRLESECLPYEADARFVTQVPQ